MAMVNPWTASDISFLSDRGVLTGPQLRYFCITNIVYLDVIRIIVTGLKFSTFLFNAKLIFIMDLFIALAEILFRQFMCMLQSQCQQNYSNILNECQLMILLWRQAFIWEHMCLSIQKVFLTVLAHTTHWNCKSVLMTVKSFHELTWMRENKTWKQFN